MMTSTMTARQEIQRYARLHGWGVLTPLIETAESGDHDHYYHKSCYRTVSVYFRQDDAVKYLKLTNAEGVTTIPTKDMREEAIAALCGVSAGVI